MQIIKGTSVSEGVTTAVIQHIYHTHPAVGRVVGDPRHEFALYETAIKEAKDELALLEAKAQGDEQDIFMVQRLMLEDGGLNTEIRNYILAGAGAAAAVERGCGVYADRLRGLDTEYLSERACDVLDAGGRVVSILDGTSRVPLQLHVPAILVADEIYPTDLVTIDRSLLRGFVSRRGSYNAHASILARTMNVPAIVQTGEALEVPDGTKVALDGTQGMLYIEPNALTLKELKKEHRVSRKEAAEWQELSERACVTQDGTRIKLLINCATREDVEALSSQNADGVGLVSSEYLLLRGITSEDAQTQEYTHYLEVANGRPVVVCAYDIGAEKTAGVFEETASNPAMGLRGIRYCLHHKSLFDAQLAALLRAGVAGDLRILLPMVSYPGEIDAVRAEIEIVKARLRTQGVPFAENLPLGIILETPSAAMMLREMVSRVDFILFGPNDLAQYVYAADRTSEVMQDYYLPDSPLIFSILTQTIAAARAAGIPIYSGLCMNNCAANSEQYVRAGLRAFVVPASNLQIVKKHLTSITLTPIETANKAKWF